MADHLQHRRQEPLGPASAASSVRGSSAHMRCSSSLCSCRMDVRSSVVLGLSAELALVWGIPFGIALVEGGKCWCFRYCVQVDL